MGMAALKARSRFATPALTMMILGDTSPHSCYRLTDNLIWHFVAL
jgi:hypothetical protein